MMNSIGPIVGIVNTLMLVVVLVDLILIGVWLWQKISKK